MAPGAPAACRGGGPRLSPSAVRVEEDGAVSGSPPAAGPPWTAVVGVAPHPLPGRARVDRNSLFRGAGVTAGTSVPHQEGPVGREPPRA